MTTILFALLIASASCAQLDPLTSIPPSSVIPTTLDTQSPSIAPSATLNPTISNQPTQSYAPTLPPTNEYCGNDPYFHVEFWDYYKCTWNVVNLTCDDDRVSCWDYGNLGPATDYCCKCKYECIGQCNDPIYTPPPPVDDDYSGCFDDYHNDDYYYDDDSSFLSGVPRLVWLLLLCCACAVCPRLIYNCMGERPARRAVQQTMSERRQQQRENNTQGLAEQERDNARYELFVTKFHFQTVLPDKSNITANSLRSSVFKPDEEHPPTKHHSDNAKAPAIGPNSLYEQLSSWTSPPSAKDECCICLECYSEGETICAAISKECNHVFHDDCILEWLKTKDRCPLCRVELLKD